MYEFIIVDNDFEMIHIVKDLIEKIIFQRNLKAKIKTFTSYDTDFQTVFTSSAFKIFILDIVMPGIYNGLDGARMIRNHSTEDVIFFLSSHEDEYRYQIFKETYRYYAFINKNEMASLTAKLLHLLDEYQTSHDVIQLCSDSEFYQIQKRKIMYLETDTLKRKLVLHLYPTFDLSISKGIHEMQALLGDDFIFINKSYLINRQYIAGYSFLKKTIFLDSGISLKIIPKKMRKKELKALLQIDNHPLV